MDENTAPDVPYVFVYNNGKMHDALPVKIVSSCNLDIYTFPFDIQKCNLGFNSYLHSGKIHHRIIISFLYRCVYASLFEVSQEGYH